MEEKIGTRIDLLIKKLGIKKVRFAERIDVDQAYITQLTQGKRNPSNRLISSICREFNVNEAWLRTGAGEMFEEAPCSILDQLAREFHLGDFDKKLARAYLNLGPEQREAFRDFFYQMVSDMQDTAVPPRMTDTQIEDEVERYRQELYARRDGQNAPPKEPDAPDVMAELAEMKRRFEASEREKAEMKKRMDALEQEDEEWEREQEERVSSRSQLL